MSHVHAHVVPLHASDDLTSRRYIVGKQVSYRGHETMRLLSVSRATIYRMINKGDLIAARLGTATRITADSFGKDGSQVPRCAQKLSVLTLGF